MGYAQGMPTTNIPQNVQKYIRRIRNPQKRKYAEEYAEYFANRGDGRLPPENGIRINGLSYMAAQAVRLEIGARFGVQPTT